MLQKANAENIQMWIDGMNRFNSTPDFGTTRILFTKPELENRKYVKKEFHVKLCRFFYLRIWVKPNLYWRYVYG